MWFAELTGFEEVSPEQVRQNICLDGSWMASKVNQRQMHWGRLEVVSLAELRARVAATCKSTGALRLSEVVANVQHLHRDPENAGALFQVASQFNLLEMVSPGVKPEHGVDIYEDDLTQGPACAIACGAGTIYRNYFVPLNGRIGQTADNQINCLSEIGEVLGNHDGQLWKMCNGYALPSGSGLREISRSLERMDEQDLDDLRQRLRVGIQWDTEVTLGATRHRVNQAFCSALPVAYTNHTYQLWSSFARVILEAAYEATFCAALLNAVDCGNNRLYLTLLGGGAFGNPEDWILSAIRRSADLYHSRDLDVAIVSFSGFNLGVRKLVREYH